MGWVNVRYTLGRRPAGHRSRERRAFCEGCDIVDLRVVFSGDARCKRDTSEGMSLSSEDAEALQHLSELSPELPSLRALHLVNLDGSDGALLQFRRNP